MPGFAGLTTVALPSAGLALAGVASLAAVGVLGIFGGGDDSDLSGIARRLDAREDPTSIERKLDDLEAAVDTLVSDADLDRHLRDPPQPDASSVEKAEALSRAVERDQLSVGPGGTADADADDGAVASAAARLQRERSPASPAGRQLLDAVSSPDRTDAGDLEAVLADAVAALDAQRTLERALSEVPESGEVDRRDARRLREELDHLDTEVASSVAGLAEAAGESRSTVERRESEREQVADAADSLTEAAADATDFDVGPDSGRSVGERLGALADAVERDELGFAGDDAGGRAASVAAEVRRERRPESKVASRLLDRLAQPGIGDLRPALETAVDQLDTAPTTEDLVGDIDSESIRDLADDVAADLDGASGPVADALEDRVADLRGTLDRAGESNVVFPYAVREELEFYDRTLVSHLGGAGRAAGGGASGPADSARAGETAGATGDADADEVAERREEIEDRYVDGRQDHNHSIPLHFLSLVDALLDDAERATAGGDAARAAGMIEAADETLDYVEKLYERTEYSVMLRRLRG